MRTTIYIAGPMRGIEYYNHPTFDGIAENLRERGYFVINPAEQDKENGVDPKRLPENHDWNELHPQYDPKLAFYDALGAIEVADVIYMLDGWQDSEHARTEKGMAEWLGKEVWYETLDTGRQQSGNSG